MEREPLLAGTIDLMVLSVIARRPAHGYAIIADLRVRSAGALDLPEGTVYPALYRLESAGLLRSAARKVEGRTRRIYRVTAAGRAALRERKSAWDGLVRSVGAVLGEGGLAGHG
ncbi:MAG: helix-turn-helix transcriptional regulator [bacterium]